LDTHRAPDLREIVGRLGGELYAGGRRALVPGPPPHSRKDRSLSLRLTDDARRILWWSHAGDPGERVWPYLGLDNAAQDREAPRETPAQRKARMDAERAERNRKLDFCRGVWAGTVAAAGSPVERYLRRRGVVGPIPAELRFHPAATMAYPTEDRRKPPTFPAMVAIATSHTGEARGLHVTALLPDGSDKAKLANPRRMFGELIGAAVRLGAIGPNGELALAEGIETALSYRDLTGTPTWAALSTSGLRRFLGLGGVKRLVIAADGDDAGMSAARDLADSASRRCEVVIVPAPEGQDWNDALKGGGQ
jgi:putative DNA primase/helicase